MINRFKNLYFFAYGQILMDSILSSVIVFYSGGSSSIFTFVYFFPIISGGLMLMLKGGLSLAAFSFFNYAIVLSSEYILLARQLPDTIRYNPATTTNILLQNISIYGLSFFLVGILSSLLARQLMQTKEALSKTTRDFDVLSLLYKQIFDDISSGIITIGPKGKITSFNRGAENITGFKAQDVIGGMLTDIFPEFNISENTEERPVLTISRRDKEQIPVGYSWAKLHMPDECDDCRVYTLQDLSKIRKMEEKVKQSEKMAAIGEIAAGIAHEFRNPLAAISGAAQVLNQEEGLSPVSLSLLNIISRECRRLEENIGDFLKFSKPAAPEKTWVSLQGQIAESWEVIRQNPNFSSHIILETDIPENTDCWADQHQLKQVLINLMHNSCLAMESSGGTITLIAKEIFIDKKPCISIDIKDDGCGIDKKMIGNIFEPFFTTRENGTGLGLAIVKQIIESHGGSISVSSTTEKETIFSFTMKLP